ncbi:MAG TPA: translation initiation factor IF-2 [Limnochordales bacterium]|nr:translation initiation factor IF-2 [Limnochordales bacterium]
MAKVRVYELARDLGVDSKQVVDFLASLGQDVKNHMSTVEDEYVARVRRQFGGRQAGAAGNAGNQARPQAASRVQAPAGGGAPARAAQPPAESGARAQRPAAAQHPEARRGAGGSGHGRGGHGGRGGRGKGRHKGQPVPQRAQRQAPPEPGSRGKLELPETIPVKELAGKVGVQAAAIVKYLFNQGIMVTVNQSLDFDTAAKIATRLGFEVVKPRDPIADALADQEDPPETLKPIPPVVTIMGHVDHGKTTLLDAIRETRVAATEAGGITQHIGAYQVQWGGKSITFLDTPGHEAFTAMRSRGAKVTDIAVLVVAADDGVKPQTVEAINHAKAADVPIIVALNKIDKPDANPDRVKQQLTEHGLVPEEWGGDTVVVPVSALKREGLDELLEMILLVAELRELKANPDRPARGVIIEAELDKGRGPVATVLVQKGTLRLGDAIVAGHASGRVRAMLDDRGQQVAEAGPAMPVSVLGLDDVPAAGDELVVVADDRIAREIAARRRLQLREQEIQRPARANLEELFQQVREGQLPELPIIIKGDVQGSVEALRGALEKLSTDEVRLNVIHAAVGGITKTDVDLAAAANAIIIGFNVRPDATARRVAEQENVDIRLYRVIYDAIEEMEKALEGMLEPEYQEVVLGRAEVRALFKVPNVGTVAGCYVTDGRIVRGAQVRVIRDGVVVHEGSMASLKRFKDDVREVAQGYECGIGLERFHDLKEGDVLEVFRMEEVPRDGR